MPPKDHDIRKRIRDYDPSTGAEPEDAYDSINFMVFLIGNIEYRVVYGDLERFLQKLEENVDALPSFIPQKRILKDFIADLRAKLLGKSITLRVLFERVLPSNDPHYFVVEAFQQLAQNPVLNALCLPFIHIQNGNPAPIDHDVMQHHIDNVGKYSLYELFYTKAKKDLDKDELKAIKNGRKLGIFSRPPARDEDFQVLDNRLRGGGSNRRVCDPNTSTCKSSDSGWCSSDANGNCAAMSSDPPASLRSVH